MLAMAGFVLCSASNPLPPSKAWRPRCGSRPGRSVCKAGMLEFYYQPTVVKAGSSAPVLVKS